MPSCFTTSAISDTLRSESISFWIMLFVLNTLKPDDIAFFSGFDVSSSSLIRMVVVRVYTGAVRTR